MIIYSNDKRYKQMGLCLSEIQENPKLIIEKITQT
jgi:hypothetical protein